MSYEDSGEHAPPNRFVHRVEWFRCAEPVNGTIFVKPASADPVQEGHLQPGEGGSALSLTAPTSATS